MLPGLRFLFAATLISASLLVFGMGAIALMRASHQQFASLPPRQPPEPVFAQAPQTVPSLSMLRVEPKSEVWPAVPRDAAPEPERSASLTSADRAIEPPAPVIAEPETSEPSPEARSDVTPPANPPPMPEVTPLAEKPVVPEAPPLAVAAAPVAPESAPETLPSPPAQVSATPQPDAPAATGSIAMPEDQPVAETPVASPPLPEARPEVATVSPVVVPAPAKAAPKHIVKRKVRKVKRQRAKSEKLPAVSSAPTLGSLFGSSSN